MKKGLQAVYKPKGISSYDVIRQIKRDFPGEKIGHGGTLDPLASGVLVIGIGREATRQLGIVLKNTTKEYVAQITLGSWSETDDAEGPIHEGGSARLPTAREIREVLGKFEGEISQIPPVYSAVKIQGKPAYKRTRAGESLILAPKKVFVESIELLSYDYPILTLRIICGSGVYIRSLARDIGEAIGTRAYMSELERVRVGEFSLT